MPEWIQQHPVLFGFITIVVFLLWRLPEWLGQVWPLFTDKKLPEWFAERRWPGMSTVLYRWFNIATTAVMIVLLGIIIYQQRGEDSKEESIIVATSTIAINGPSSKSEFASLLSGFPPAGPLPSPFIPLSPPSRKKVAIRTNTSSYERAKAFGQWFKEAEWAVVDVADVLGEKFADGITIRASYDSGDAENVHVALCKLGYEVRREVPDPPSATSLLVGIPTPPLPDYIILEVGNLSP